MDPPPIKKKKKEEALRMERKRNKALRQHVTFLVFLLFLDPPEKKYSIKMVQCVATER
jgi:hypothetical protein